jgi:hypothetical protein
MEHPFTHVKEGKGERKKRTEASSTCQISGYVFHLVTVVVAHLKVTRLTERAAEGRHRSY